jgi:hypothetical protein
LSLSFPSPVLSPLRFVLLSFNLSLSLRFFGLWADRWNFGFQISQDGVEFLR